MYRLACLLIFLVFSLTGRSQQKLTPHPDTSFTVYSAYNKAKKTQPFIKIADPHPAGIKTACNIPYCNVGTHDLLLDVFYPEKKAKRAAPAVLLIFGGGWHSGDRSQLNAAAKILASKGYIAVTADYRLSTEALYPAAVNDLKSAIRWIRANASPYNIDKNKIAAFGFSAGGQLAALLGSTNESTLFEANACNKNQPDNLQAVVDADGLLAFIHPESGEGNDSRAPSAATLWFGAPKTAGTTLWEQASALTHVGKRNPPILFLNSSVKTMHAGRDDMMRKLDSLKIYSEVHTFEDAPHPFPLFEPWFTPAMEYTVAFLNKVFGR